MEPIITIKHGVARELKSVRDERQILFPTVI